MSAQQILVPVAFGLAYMVFCYVVMVFFINLFLLTGEPEKYEPPDRFWKLVKLKGRK